MSSHSISYWEKTAQFDNIDVLIAGAGIVGLNTAIALKSESPSLRVIVADRSAIPLGASTKNAGFACFGSTSELLDDLQTLTENEVYQLVEKRWRGLQAMRSMLGDDVIDFNSYGGYEIFTTEQSALFDNCQSALANFNKMLEQISGFENVYSIRNDKISQFGFKKINNIIYNELEGQLHPGKMMQALRANATQLGVEIWNGVDIAAFHEEENKIRISSKNNGDFQCKNFVVTTNGFASSLLPNLDVQPGRGQVFLTEKIPNHKLKGVFHFDRGYVYFRDIGDRILIGGGRNIDIQNETTTEFGNTKVIEDYISNILHTHILNKHDVKFEMKWSGIMGLGKQRSTIIKKLSDHLYCGVRLGGMGVAIGTLVGRDLASLIMESN